MNNKNKKNLLSFLLTIAIGFLFASQVLPIVSFSKSDMWQKKGYDIDDLVVDFSFEQSVAWFYQRRIDGRLQRVGGDVIKAERYSIFFVFSIETDNWNVLFKNDDYLTYEPNAGTYFSSQNTAAVVFFTGMILCLIAAYFIVLSFNNIDIKKTKYPLYVAVLLTIALLITVLSTRRMLVWNSPNQDYYNYVNLEYGFYFLVVSIVLLVFIYFLQNFIDYSDSKKLM